MGRYGTRDTVEGTNHIDLAWLKRNAYLRGGLTSGGLQWLSGGEKTGSIAFQISTFPEDPYLQLTYRVREPSASDAEWRRMDYKFPLERIQCHYGGYKWFIRCSFNKNGVCCGRRVRVLYSIGDWFGCRRCADLTYQSCNEGKHLRSGTFGVFSTLFKSDEYLATLKRRYYRGKPTRKYRKYLKIGSRLTQKDYLDVFKDEV